MRLGEFLGIITIMISSINCIASIVNGNTSAALGWGSSTLACVNLAIIERRFE